MAKFNNTQFSTRLEKYFLLQNELIILYLGSTFTKNLVCEFFVCSLLEKCCNI